MKVKLKTEENLFKTYLSKIITSAFESGLVEREKKFRPEIISNDLLDIINHCKSQTREETIREVKEMLSKIVLKDLSGKWSEEVIDFSTSIVDATVFKIKRLLNKLKK